MVAVEGLIRYYLIDMATILIVDDDSLVLGTMRKILRECGNHTVVNAANGAEAQTLLETQDIDLMITDIRMGPMDGMQLLVSARAAKPDLPIIVSSALTSDAVIQQAAQLGVAGYIKKPFRMSEMIDVVERALAGRK